MGVDGEDGTPEREEKHDARGFLAHARRCEQPCERGLGGHACEKRQVEAPFLRPDPPKRRADGRRLLALQPGGGDRVREVVELGFRDLVERREAGRQGRVRPVSVDVGRVLGEDRQDERGQRIGGHGWRGAEGVPQSAHGPTRVLISYHAEEDR